MYKVARGFESLPLLQASLLSAVFGEKGSMPLGGGPTLEQIKDDLLNARDLSKKGSRNRQVELC